MDRHRRRIAALVPAGFGLAALHAPHLGAQTQALPETARIITGFAVGGTVDVTARRVADRLRDVVARSVVVDTRTGAGGQIALSGLKSAAPDGLTIALTPMSMLGIYPHTYRKLPYDPQADFLPVSQAIRFDCGFAVGPSVPESVRSLADFAAWVKANPKQGNFGSPAAGSVPHFVGELYSRRAGLELRHAPYRGSQPAIVDLMGGQLSAVSAPLGEYLQHIPTGKVRMIATSGAERSRFAPNVPTFAEQGFRDIIHDEWFGFFVPAQTPVAVVDRLSAAIGKALAAPEVVEGLAAMGLEARSSTPAALAAMLKADSERWAPLIKTIGFTAES